MVQLGFVIDHTRCIGCHACTVACKSENDVPLGDFRTWVKYVEQGTFPEVKRSFAVLRCNQCSDAPCVTICPVRALEKRSADGIVDVDPNQCIGCKACMQACPYDALYINDATGTAQKCHFCAHRVERGLAPACAVVCPTEAIVPGDFHDADSRVSRLRDEHDLRARKVEAGTGPNVLYREVADAGIDPGLTNGAGGYLWSQTPAGARLAAEVFAAHDELETRARTTYDVAHEPVWGGRVSGYLLTKAIAAGAFVAGVAALAAADPAGAGHRALAGAIGVTVLVFLAITGALLVADLKRPERFLRILFHPNPRSWLVWGAYIISAYGLLAAVFTWQAITGAVSLRGGGAVFLAVTGLLALATAAYTGFLFGQAKGRVLWMRRGYWLHLAVQALVAGSAALLLLSAGLAFDPASTAMLGHVLLYALPLHAAFTLVESTLAPQGREAEYRRASRLLTHGPLARRHWWGGVVVGIALPVVLLLLGGAGPFWWLGAAAALAGLAIEKDALVRAGQMLPIS